MAAVTVSGAFERHVFGDCAVRFFTIAGISGTTLATGMQQIKFVAVQPGSLITSFTISGGTITFTSSNTMNETIMVIARVG